MNFINDVFFWITGNILNPKVKHPYAQTFICSHNKIYRFGKCREENTENPESAQVVQDQTIDYLTSKDFNKGLLEVVTFKSVVLLSIMMFLIIVCYAFKGKISQRYTPTSTENAELTSVSSVEVSTDKMIFRTQDSDSVMISN